MSNSVQCWGCFRGGPLSGVKANLENLVVKITVNGQEEFTAGSLLCKSCRTHVMRKLSKIMFKYTPEVQDESGN